jgi:DNA mismatch endonuclease, patch repair protein
MGLNRSEQMARIRGSDTSPEVALRRALWARGFRYRLKVRTPGGSPDVTFPKERLAVFIDGCFWHGCPLHYARPRSRQDFWSAKLAENIDRDWRQSKALQAAGWCVVRLWEHEVILDLVRATQQVELALKRSVEAWTMQRRVRRVVDLGGGLERREFVTLGSPEAVVEFVDGTRITAKARVLKGTAGRRRTDRR